ncbi:MAG: regulator [Mycobacterium sp.]|nr:MAG: regulator [Mycobacterium sp.]
MEEHSAQFGVLGPLTLTVEGTPVSVGTPKQRVVLAALLINRNRVVGVDSLINAAWGDDAVAEARASVHVYVSNLRRLLANAGIEDPRAVLQKAPPGYRFNIPDTALDLGRFISEKAAGVNAAAAGQFQKATGHFSAALAQWRGEFLEDLRGFDFVEAFAVALMEDKIAVHLSRVQAEMACGRAASVLGELETLVAANPYREPLWAELMSAYYLSHRQSEALDTFQRLKAILADELGIDPNPAVRELHERVLRQEPLDIARAAKQTAAQTLLSTRSSMFGAKSGFAQLREPSGRIHFLEGTALRIGRLSDNDIVLSDPKISRYHAVIIDTGTSYVINDAGSANGVTLGNKRIQGSAALSHGDRIGIGDCQFTFEVCPTKPAEL